MASPAASPAASADLPKPSAEGPEDQRGRDAGQQEEESTNEDQNAGNLSAGMDEGSMSGDSVEDQVSAKLTFTDPRAMRGMPLHMMLSRFGHIWRDSDGSAATFLLSRPAKHLHGFLSHNWSTPRMAKFRALMMYYNLRKAIAFSLVAAGGGTVLTVRGVVPYMELNEKPHMPRSLVCLLTGGLGFWLALLFGHDLGHLLASLLGRPEPEVFLDKTCIHQTDQEMKRLGIDSLGAFLVQSERIIILHSDTYFQKIWTVYELACFLCTKTVASCVFLSIYHPPILISGWWLIFAYFATAPLVRNFPGGNQLMMTLLAGLISTYIGLLVAGRGWQAIAQLQAKLRTFSMDACHCHDPRDRPIVYDSVAAFMKYRRFVSRASTPREALEAFERQVRTQMGEVLDGIVGRTMLKYTQVLTMVWPQMLVGFDYVGAKWARGDPAQAVAAAAAYATAEALLSWPLGVGLGLMLMRLPAQLGFQSAIKRAAFAAPCALLVCAVFYGMDSANDLLTLRIAEASGVGAWRPCLVYLAFLSAVAFVVRLTFGDLPKPRCCASARRPGSRTSLTFERAPSALFAEPAPAKACLAEDLRGAGKGPEDDCGSIASYDTMSI